MKLPGSRTGGAIVRKALAPVASMMEQAGAFAVLRDLRLAAIRRHLARQEVGRAKTTCAHVDWAHSHHSCSEPGGSFFSDNLVSNERTFLDAAPALASLPSDVACLGVGPEPLLSYVGILDCPLTFVVDVRRDNARLHFLYRALFEIANSRSEWLALLLGRPYDGRTDPGGDASLDAVIDHATSASPTDVAFEEAHTRAMQALERLPPFLLPFDRRCIRRIHTRFFRHQLSLTFQTDGIVLRRYPSLEDLLRARTPDGTALGFLSSEWVFRRIRRREITSSVIPVVGDFAGRFALSQVRCELDRRGLCLGALYASNVEQYIFEQGQWLRWIKNLRALPLRKDAIIIRSYFVGPGGPAPDPPRTLLGQAARFLRVYSNTRNSLPLPMHQMLTIVHRLDHFLNKAERYSSYREIVADPDLVWHGH